MQSVCSMYKELKSPIPTGLVLPRDLVSFWNYPPKSVLCDTFMNDKHKGLLLYRPYPQKQIEGQKVYGPSFLR